MSGSSAETAGYRVIRSRRYFAITTGLIQPRVYLSSRLTEDLEGCKLQAVLAHEHGHRLRRDALRMLTAEYLSYPHFRATRRALLAELGLAIEQSCDEIAARSLGDRPVIADTILKLSRKASNQGMSEFALSVGQPGSEIQAPIAIVILFGLLSSTMLSMIVVPALSVRFGDIAVGRSPAWLRNDD